jgi:tRNA uridine 5-carbamoylmethylation protein Kti12
MPCIILTGHPSSGKTTVAKLLRDRALVLQQQQQHNHSAGIIDHVILINEESECDSGTTKNECYQTPIAEKATRATLKAAFDRAVGDSTLTPTQRKRRLIIFDSLNYIKGYRYELYCISKAAGEVHAVLWVLNKPQIVREWNNKNNNHQPPPPPQQQQQQESHTRCTGSYSSALLEELIQRYEPPDERNRWDQPLFTIDMAAVTTLATTASVTASVTTSTSNDGTMENIVVDAATAAADSSPTMTHSSERRTPLSLSYLTTATRITTNTTTTTTKSELLQQSVYNMHDLGEALLLESANGMSTPHNVSHNNVQEEYAGNGIGIQTTATTTTANTTTVPKSKQTKSAFQRAKPKPKKESTVSATTTSCVMSPNDKPALYAYTPDDLWNMPSKSTSSSSCSNTKLKNTQTNRVGEATATLPWSSLQFNNKNNNDKKDDVLTTTGATDIVTTMDAQPQFRSLEEQLDDILYALLNNTKALKEGFSTQQHVVGQAIGWKAHYSDR